MADARNATAWLPLPSVFCPARRAAATRLSPTGRRSCRFPLVRRHRTRNGAGKTTAVLILATLLQPDEGSASVDGHDVVREPHQARKLIGLTGQYASVDGTLSGTENLYLIGRLTGLSRQQAKQRAREQLEQFGIADAASRAARTYSEGMRRLLDLAASLVARPRVLYLDEPSTGLDPRSRNEVWDVVRDLTGQGVTVLLTTQYLEEADQLADHIAVVDHGRVIAEGTPDELKARTGAQTITVRPLNPDDLSTLINIVGTLTLTQPEVRGTTVTAPVTDPDLAPAVVRRLDEAGVRLAELTLRGSTLDEVFLSLTGSRTDVPETAEAMA